MRRRNLAPKSKRPGTQHPNEWLTFYYHIHVGTWGSPNSTIQAWFAYQGGNLQPFVNMSTQMILCNNYPTCSTDPAVFNHMTLTIYNTGYTGTGNPQASVWYCCFIISTSQYRHRMALRRE